MLQKEWKVRQGGFQYLRVYLAGESSLPPKTGSSDGSHDYATPEQATDFHNTPEQADIRHGQDAAILPIVLSRRLFSAPQNRGHDTRAAASVHYGNDPQRLFVWRICDQIFVYQSEPQGPGGKIRASMALLRKGHQLTDHA
jgi:hypothetical protein